MIATFSGLSATSVVVEAFLQGTSAGSVVVAGGDALGTLAATNPTIVRCSASAYDGNAATWFSFKLAEPTVFTATDGARLTGDEFRLSPAAPTEVVGTLKHVVLQGVGLEGLRLTDETAQQAPVPALVLEIHRAGAGVAVSWPATRNHSLVSRPDVSQGSWQSYGLGAYRYADIRSHVNVPELTNTTRHFQLRHFYHYYIDPDQK